MHIAITFTTRHSTRHYLPYLFPFLSFMVASSFHTLADGPDTVQVMPDEEFMYRLGTNNHARFADSLGQLLYHYATVGQYYDHYALTCKIGELAVCKSGYRYSITYDHPLWGYFSTPPLRVYKYDSIQYANRIMTNVFRMKQGDSLIFLRDALIEWPHSVSNGHATFDIDTSLTISGDTLRFLVLLIQDSTGAVLDTLTRVVYLPYSNFTALAVQYYDNVMRDSLYFDRATIYKRHADSAWCSQWLRIEIIPELMNMYQGEYSDREINVTFFWDRLSDLLDRDYQRGYTYGDTAFSKKRHDDLTALNISVYPTSISRTNPKVNIVSPVDLDGDYFVELFDTLGRTVYHARLNSIVKGTHYRVVLTTLAKGSYTLRIRTNTTIVLHQTLIVK